MEIDVWERRIWFIGLFSMTKGGYANYGCLYYGNTEPLLAAWSTKLHASAVLSRAKGIWWIFGMESTLDGWSQWDQQRMAEVAIPAGPVLAQVVKAVSWPCSFLCSFLMEEEVTHSEDWSSLLDWTFSHRHVSWVRLNLFSLTRHHILQLNPFQQKEERLYIIAHFHLCKYLIHSANIQIRLKINTCLELCFLLYSMPQFIVWKPRMIVLV